MDERVTPALLQEVLDAYIFPGPVVSARRYGAGHVNDTFCVVCRVGTEQKRFILQGLSMTAFPEPEKVMENMVRITGHLRRGLPDEDAGHRTLTLVPDRTGRIYYTASNGQVWRMTHFIENTVCLELADARLFAEAARSYGDFQYALRDFPAETLWEPIARFHDTPDRFRKLQAAAEADCAGRARQVARELDFARARQADCTVAWQAQQAGLLPLRVTHNDTKLSNILFDAGTGRGVCVIDLDTTMPGLAIHDFGDAIRAGAKHNADDESDLDRVALDMELFAVYTRGYLAGTGGILTPTERAYLPWGARLMTLECGMRFLTDYLEGDRYFRIRDPEQNLRRCRTQFRLLADMEARFAQMCDIAQKYGESCPCRF